MRPPCRFLLPPWRTPSRGLRPRTLASAAALALLLLATAAAGAPSVRLKDLARVRGVRENQLVGYGLVIGLAGTGDSPKSIFTLQSVLTMLERLGVPVDPALRQQVAAQAARGGSGGGQGALSVRNLAAVILTADLPPFAVSGDRVDVTVAGVGDAQSLQGGILLRAPLLAADGKVYMVAQGPVSLGGGGERGAGGGGARGGAVHPTVGRVPQGGIVEGEFRSDFVEPDGSIAWILRQPDFTTAARIAAAVNARYEPDIARAVSADEVRVTLPANYINDPVRFVARLEEIEVAPDAEARVVVNERTGTIVFGADVRVSPVAVSHGGLSVTVRGGGNGAAARNGTSGGEAVFALPEAATVGEVVQGLNAIGASSRDVIAILQAIREAGALHARLEVM